MSTKKLYFRSFLLKNLASLKKNNYDVNEAEKSLRVFYSLLFYLDSQVKKMKNYFKSLN